MSEKGYNTNLAAEFYVLSVLHRLGTDAVLTLGNKKSVDIAVVRAAGDSITVDVKGLAGTTAWPVDNVKEPRAGHFLVFVCYGGKISNTEVLPEVWVIPSNSLEPYVYISLQGRRVVQRSKLNKEAEQFKNAWRLLSGGL
jgi:hypothetical protein